MDSNHANSFDIHSPEFWKEQWRLSLTGSTELVGRGYSTPAFWDTRSKEFDRGFDTDSRKKLDNLVADLEQKDLLHEGMSVLDVGCGTGRLAMRLARQGAQVTALDFSSGMLERLKGNIPAELSNRIEIVQADWETLSLESLGWERRFDLVVANMTPAVGNPATFDKLMAASRRGCFIKAWAEKRRNLILADLWERILKKPLRDSHSIITCLFNILLTMGCFPDLTFEEIVWDRSEPVEQVITDYLTFFSGALETMTDEIRDAIVTAIETIAVNGMVEEKIRGRTGLLTWRIDGE